jgi:hypothetical protein
MCTIQSGYYSRQSPSQLTAKLFQTVLGMLGESGMIGADSYQTPLQFRCFQGTNPCTLSLQLCNVENAPIAYLAYSNTVLQQKQLAGNLPSSEASTSIILSVRWIKLR